MKIYKNKIVEGISDFYGALLFETDRYSTIKDHLAAIADRMWEGIQEKNNVLYHEISNYHPGFLGKTFDELSKTEFTLEDCTATIACEYGFSNWQHLEMALGETAYNLNFELAVNNLINRNLEALKQQITHYPGLVKQRSQYGHGATLLHYTASNGVELWRQQVPANLPEITVYLLETGADVHAEMKIYGGEYATLALLTSSAHPFDAGVGEEMVELLKGFNEGVSHR